MPNLPPNSPLRILHCIASFSGGGAENQLATLCEAAEAHAPGLAFHVAHLYGGTHLERVNGTRTVVHSIQSRGHHDPRIVLSLAKIIRQNQIDIVHTWLPTFDVLGGVAARLSRRPMVLSERSSSECYDSDWTTTMRRSLGKRAAAIVANSPAGMRYWEKLARPERLHLIPNALDSRRLSNGAELTAEEMDIARRAPRLVVVAGRFTLAKNLKVLCDALDQIVRTRSDVNVLIFGDGELRGEVEQRLASTPPGRIQLMGFTSKLPAWLRAADLLISLSKFEGQPNVVLEAAFLRVPQVLSDIPQHQEAVTPNGAFFTPLDSPAQACEAVERCLDDRALREQKVAAAFSSVANLDRDRIIGQYEALYRSIVRSR